MKMRCEECQAHIEDYFDGELDEQTRELVAQHVSACAPCASLHARLEGEHELYLSYECDARPAPDFWDNVMARATAQGVSARAPRPLSRQHLLRDWLASRLGNLNAQRFSPSLTALIVLITIGVTIGVMRFTNSKEKVIVTESRSQKASEPERAPATNEIVKSEDPSKEDKAGGRGSGLDAKQQPIRKRAEVKGRSVLIADNERAGSARLNRNELGRNAATPDQLVREAEQKYVAAIAMLSRDVNRRRSRLDADTIARFERTLATIDRTIADTRQVARKHPGDPVAAQYMLTAYARKVDVLREMVGY
jgi:hypothetical protein